MDGCDVSAVFSSATALIPKALATGNLTLRQNALAREIEVDREGCARAVSFVDTSTGKEETVQAKIVALCCATIESARLLLNSRSPQHPNGLVNSNDVVGRYLNGHSGSSIRVYVEELQGLKPSNQDGATDHAFIPRYNHLFRKPTYAGGWDIQVNFASYMFPQQAMRLPGYGADFKTRVRRMQPGYLQLGWFGKVVARPDNRVTVDRTRRDAYGIPIAVVRFRFGENDVALWDDSLKSVTDIGSRIKGEMFLDAVAQPSGFASHEVGTARMGKDPRRSVLNGYCQAHDVKNLFVTDGSAFTTSSEKNPTLTIMALSLRAADYIKEQRRKGEL
jgi:choline dehydrogenase-like flavoprotein